MSAAHRTGRLEEGIIPLGPSVTEDQDLILPVMIRAW